LGFSPAGLTLAGSTGFYTQTNRMCPDLKEGKSLIGAEYRSNVFYTEVNAVALENQAGHRRLLL
jgi:hypothetical protein